MKQTKKKYFQFYKSKKNVKLCVVKRKKKDLNC